MTDWDRLASGDGLGPADRAMTRLLGIAESGDVPAFFRALKQHTETLRELLAQDPGEYAAWRASIKAACSKINLKTLDALVNPPTVGGSDSITSTLPRLAAERCELWHDKDGNAYGTITRDDHREHWRLDSAGFRDWLAFLAYSQSGRSASSENLKAATNALAGQAKFDGPEFIPCWRVGHRDGSYWLDLGDDRWRAVEITATGWAIRDNPPVRFLRTKATRPLPEPVSGGDVAELWELVNVPEQERLLVLAWILECYRADTPYTLLELTGEQGSAKSTAQRILRRFIDPNAVELRGRPKTVEDIFVAAANSHLISYENLSGLTNDQSDALCTICTGGGYASRRFFTNGEEHLLEAHNPVVLNGISPVVIRPDLLDRSISVALPVITHRRTDSEVQEALNRAAPKIMGALLDLLCETLALLPTVQIPPESLPRMADFARLGEALSRVLKHPQGHFLRLYAEHRRTSITRTIEGSPVAAALVDFAQCGHTYGGTVKGLLELLSEKRPDLEREDYWPRSPKGLGDALRRFAPALRQLGIEVHVEQKPRRDGVHCTIGSVCSGETAGKQVHEVHKFTDVEEI